MRFNTLTRIVQSNLLASLSAFLLVVSAVWYGCLILTNVIQPSVATFMLASLVMAISEWAYWSGEKPSILGNIAMHAGTANIAVILLCLVGRRMYDGDLVADFTQFQYGCIAASSAILVVWKLTKLHSLGYCLMQVIALIAYLPTIERVLMANIQTESNILWSAILLSSLAAAPSALKRYRQTWHKDWLGLVYLARTIPSNLFMVYLVAAKSLAWPPF